MVKKLLMLCFIVSLSLVTAQIKEVEKPTIPSSSHLLLAHSKNGMDLYKRKSDNHLLNGKYEICESFLNEDTDIVNSYYHSGLCEVGSFNKGYKTGFWKTTYKGKLVKTENWNNGLILGKYKVYDTDGNILYQTNFGSKGSGKYKDYYYKTGILKEEGAYENGRKEGEWCTYDETGKLKSTIKFEEGKEIAN